MRFAMQLRNALLDMDERYTNALVNTLFNKDAPEFVREVGKDLPVGMYHSGRVINQTAAQHGATLLDRLPTDYEASMRYAIPGSVGIIGGTLLGQAMMPQAERPEELMLSGQI